MVPWAEGCTAGCTDHRGRCKVGRVGIDRTGRVGIDRTGSGPGLGQAVVWAAGCCMPWTGNRRGLAAGSSQERLEMSSSSPVI